jgi:hypothetical protein
MKIVVATDSAVLSVGLFRGWSSYNNFAHDKATEAACPIQIDYVRLPLGYRAGEEPTTRPPTRAHAFEGVPQSNFSRRKITPLLEGSAQWPDTQASDNAGCKNWDIRAARMDFGR